MKMSQQDWDRYSQTNSYARAVAPKEPDTSQPFTPPNGLAEHLPYTQALWYAWGRQDEGARMPGDAFRFAELHLTKHREFEAGQTNHLRSIQDLFADWQEAGQ